MQLARRLISCKKRLCQRQAALKILRQLVDTNDPEVQHCSLTNERICGGAYFNALFEVCLDRPDNVLVPCFGAVFEHVRANFFRLLAEILQLQRRMTR